MAASDTVVGIVGAILLVGVMVGVFAYEYSNAPDDGSGDGTDPDTQASIDAFQDAYPGLDPEGDIDGDGNPNHSDTDMDNDGVPDTEDDAIEVEFFFSGGPTSAAALNQADIAQRGFIAQEGVSFVQVDFEASGLDPAGLTVDLELEITDPVGASQTIGAGSGHGANGPAGDWELVVRTPSVAVMASYEITVTVTY